MSICLFVCVFTFEVPFKSLFAPISQHRLSKTFWVLESLGESNGKKCSHIWNLLLKKGVIAIQKESCGRICKDQEVIQQGSAGYTTRIRRLLAGFFLLWVLLSLLVKRCFVFRMQDLLSNKLFLEILHFNPYYYILRLCIFFTENLLFSTKTLLLKIETSLL